MRIKKDEYRYQYLKGMKIKWLGHRTQTVHHAPKDHWDGWKVERLESHGSVC
jgi:hypothetical protein